LFCSLTYSAMKWSEWNAVCRRRATPFIRWVLLYFSILYRNEESKTRTKKVEEIPFEEVKVSFSLYTKKSNEQWWWYHPACFHRTFYFEMSSTKYIYSKRRRRFAFLIQKLYIESNRSSSTLTIWMGKDFPQQ